jgi:Family of unknown function (DUF5995)
MSILESEQRSDQIDLGPVWPMSDEDLAALRPKDIDEAVHYMRNTLTQFHGQRDKRAIFLRVYYIMTLEVHAAIYQLGDYKGKRIFYDRDWVKSLSGKFSSLYFHSLNALGRDLDTELAWQEAYKTARRSSSSVVENATLGINAHINKDLGQAIAENLDPKDLNDYPTLQLRKFDHDQVNNLLVRTLEYIQDVLARDYEPGIEIADHLLGSLDERLSTVGLKYYRERVWWDAMAFASAQTKQSDDLVRDKLNWESYKIALFIESKKWLWQLERGLGVFLWPFRRRTPWDRIVLEEGGVKGKYRTPLHPTA